MTYYSVSKPKLKIYVFPALSCKKKNLLDIQNANNSIHNVKSTQVHYAHFIYFLNNII